MTNESLGKAESLKNRIAPTVNLTVHAYEVIDSTNRAALDYAASGEWDGTPAVFIADGQTNGRGRLGRSFISEGGVGIYLSILTRADSTDSSLAVGITTYAAVTASRVIERMTGLSPEIKWVNDIYLGKKKLAGILTQGVVDPTTGRLTATVMGIGINILGEPPKELADIATTLEAEYKKAGLDSPTPERIDIAAGIIEEYLRHLDRVGTSETADEYRSRSFLIGRSVTVHTPTASYPALVTGIDDECHLLLRHPDGTTSSLSTGEVSVHPTE